MNGLRLRISTGQLSFEMLAVTTKPVVIGQAVYWNLTIGCMVFQDWKIVASYSIEVVFGRLQSDF